MDGGRRHPLADLDFRSNRVEVAGPPATSTASNVPGIVSTYTTRRMPVSITAGSVTYSVNPALAAACRTPAASNTPAVRSGVRAAARPSRHWSASSRPDVGRAVAGVRQVAAA